MPTKKNKKTDKKPATSPKVKKVAKIDEAFGKFFVEKKAKKAAEDKEDAKVTPKLDDSGAVIMVPVDDK